MLELSADAENLAGIATALKYEEDGVRRRREFGRELRLALGPAVVQAKQEIMSMGSSGLPAAGSPLRASIAAQVKAETRMSGRNPGARVKVTKRRMPRGFVNAPKRTNQQGGWRHRVYGRDVWVQQIGKPGWFDDPMRRNAPRYRAAVVKVLEDTAERIRRGA